MYIPSRFGAVAYCSWHSFWSSPIASGTRDTSYAGPACGSPASLLFIPFALHIRVRFFFFLTSRPSSHVWHLRHRYLSSEKRIALRKEVSIEARHSVTFKHQVVVARNREAKYCARYSCPARHRKWILSIG